MSRLCHDCGIADWQPCQCDPHAGLNPPRNPYQATEQARRPPITLTTAGDPILPCPACGADTGERCRPGCEAHT